MDERPDGVDREAVELVGGEGHAGSERVLLAGGVAARARGRDRLAPIVRGPGGAADGSRCLGTPTPVGRRRMATDAVPACPSAIQPRRRPRAPSGPSSLATSRSTWCWRRAPDLSAAPTCPVVVALRQGGSAANTARWLARLGVRTTLVCAVGRDGPGARSSRRCGATASRSGPSGRPARRPPDRDARRPGDRRALVRRGPRRGRPAARPPTSARLVPRASACSTCPPTRCSARRSATPAARRSSMARAAGRRGSASTWPRPGRCSSAGGAPPTPWSRDPAPDLLFTNQPRGGRVPRRARSGAAPATSRRSRSSSAARRARRSSPGAPCRHRSRPPRRRDPAAHRRPTRPAPATRSTPGSWPPGSRAAGGRDRPRDAPAGGRGRQPHRGAPARAGAPRARASEPAGQAGGTARTRRASARGGRSGGLVAPVIA